MARVLSWIVFALLMAVILPASFAVVVLLYLPWVCLRALYLMVAGKAKPRFLQSEEERARFDQPPQAREGPVPF
ncbi:MAG: hypothetical protein R3F56_15315 [Planctomycetota bacterium]